MRDLRGLPIPAQYFPIHNEKYEIKTGLYPLTFDFGNGKLDSATYQIDTDYHYFLSQKQLSCSENLAKYYVTHELRNATISAINKFVIDTLVTEYPNYFVLDAYSAGSKLICKLTDNEIMLPSGRENLKEQIDIFHKLAMQIQEDSAVVQFDEKGVDYVSALHLCLPNYWSANDKIGENFLSVHQPIPGMARINRQSGKMLKAIIDKGPYVRFAWGLVTDKRLNHHPEAPQNMDPVLWRGRRFKLDNPQLYIRVERQTIRGFAEQKALLFTIRTYFQNVLELKKSPSKLRHLVGAISSMDENNLHYKGINESKSDILRWLSN